MIKADGDITISMSLEMTARAGEVPVSKGRTSTLAPYFLKRPSFSATYRITEAKIGGIHGAAITIFELAAFTVVEPMAPKNRAQQHSQ